MEEMMETEKKYVADMEMVKHCFMKPLEDELKVRLRCLYSYKFNRLYGEI